MVPLSDLMDEDVPADGEEEDYTEDYIAIPIWGVIG